MFQTCTRNLISSALLMIAGFKQTLDAGKLVITKNGGYVGKAFCNGNLFVLDVMNEISGSASAYFVCALDTWHGRLGHLNVNSIKRLKHANLISDNLEKDISKCEICVEAKHARKPFSHPIDRKSELLNSFILIWLILKTLLVEVVNIIILPLLMIFLDI